MTHKIALSNVQRLAERRRTQASSKRGASYIDYPEPIVRCESGVQDGDIVWAS